LKGKIEVLDPQFYEDTYSLNDVSSLCEIGGFEPADLGQIQKELYEIAAVYRWESSKHADLPRSSDVARDLKGLIKRVTKLNEGLENLPDEAAYFLRMAVDKNNTHDSALTITDKLPKNTSSLVIPLPDDALPVVAVDLPVPDVRQLLSGLERAAQGAIESLPKRGRGQQRDHGLRLWMSNIATLWKRNTHIPFTRDETASGEPITPAACFCVAAFHYISPDYAVSRILWEMRDCIRQSK
jgi:hypothetical protein